MKRLKNQVRQASNQANATFKKWHFLSLIFIENPISKLINTLIFLALILCDFVII